MTYVPMVYVPPPPTQRARDLGAKLRATIDDFRRDDPSVTATDVDQALRLAVEVRRGGTATALIALLLGLLVLLGGLFVFLGGDLQEVPTIAVIAGLAMVAAVVAAVVAARRS